MPPRLEGALRPLLRQPLLVAINYLLLRRFLRIHALNPALERPLHLRAAAANLLLCDTSVLYGNYLILKGIFCIKPRLSNSRYALIPHVIAHFLLQKSAFKANRPSFQ